MAVATMAAGMPPDESLSMMPVELAATIESEAEQAPSTDIFTASALGAYDRVRELLQSHAVRDINAPNSGGWTPLIYAAHVGHDNVVSLLIEEGKANPNCCGRDGASALIQASSCGNESIVYVLLQYGANVNYADRHGGTALHHAASSGHEGVVRALLKHGVDIDARDGRQETPMFKAAVAGFESVVNTLLQHGAVASVVNYKGLSIEQAVMASPSPNLAVVSLLKQKELGPPSSPRRSASLAVGGQAGSQASVPSSPTSLRSPASLSAAASPRHHGQRSPKQHPRSSSTKNSAVVSQEPHWAEEIEDLREFLHMLGLEKYLTLFEEQEIDFPTLLTMNEQDLKEIGLNVFGPRRKIARAISGWHSAHTEPRFAKPTRQKKSHRSNLHGHHDETKHTAASTTLEVDGQKELKPASNTAHQPPSTTDTNQSSSSKPQPEQWAQNVSTRALATEVEELNRRVEKLSSSLTAQKQKNVFLEEELKAQRQTVRRFQRTHSGHKQVRFHQGDVGGSTQEEVHGDGANN